MAAALRQVGGARLERRRHVKVDRCAHGAANLVAHEGGGDHRTGQVVGKTACDEPEQAGRPGVVADDERCLAGDRLGQQTSGVDRHLRHLPPPFMDQLELVGHRLGARRICLEQQRHRHFSIGDPAGRVDARHDAEGEIARGRLPG